MVKAYLGVTKNTLANVGIGIRFKLMYNGADVAFSPQLPVVKDGADGASINIRGHVIGHGFDEGEYGTWRENSNVTAEMRKKPFLVDNYGNSGVKTLSVIHRYNHILIAKAYRLIGKSVSFISYHNRNW